VCAHQDTIQSHEQEFAAGIEGPRDPRCCHACNRASDSPVHKPTTSRAGRRHEIASSSTSDRDGDWELYTIRPDRRDLKRLTRSPGNDAHAIWSLDGEWDRVRQRAWRVQGRDARGRSQWSGAGDIFVMRWDGTDVRQLTDDASRKPHRVRAEKAVIDVDRGRQSAVYLVVVQRTPIACAEAGIWTEYGTSLSSCGSVCVRFRLSGVFQFAHRPVEAAGRCATRDSCAHLSENSRPAFTNARVSRDPVAGTTDLAVRDLQ
jgi:hypothetical protein